MTGSSISIRPGSIEMRNNATRTNGFASKLEAAVYDQLVLRMKAGEISRIECQDVVDLGLGIKWKIDFKCKKPNGEAFWVEAKGYETREYRMKLKMWKCGGGKGVLEIYKGTHLRPVLVETVTPRIEK